MEIIEKIKNTFVNKNKLEQIVDNGEETLTVESENDFISTLNVLNYLKKCEIDPVVGDNNCSEIYEIGPALDELEQAVGEFRPHEGSSNIRFAKGKHKVLYDFKKQEANHHVTLNYYLGWKRSSGSIELKHLEFSYVTPINKEKNNSNCYGELLYDHQQQDCQFKNALTKLHELPDDLTGTLYSGLGKTIEVSPKQAIDIVKGESNEDYRLSRSCSRYIIRCNKDGGEDHTALFGWGGGFATINYQAKFTVPKHGKK